MNMNHKCIWCHSPCELTLAFTSEGCSNENCQAYRPAPPAEVKRAAKKAAANPSDCDYCHNGNLLCNAGGAEECKECGRLREEEKRKRDYNRNVRTGRLSAKGPNHASLPRADEGRSGSISKEFMEGMASTDYTPIGGFSTGIPELDATFAGGVPAGRLSELSDYPGTGAAGKSMTDYAKADAEATARLHEAHERERRAQIERDILRWPNTMRVVTGERKVSRDKKGMNLVGVLSLVEAPYNKKGALAIYDYISMEHPTAGRCRFRVRRLTHPDQEVPVTPGGRHKKGAKYVVDLSFSEQIDVGAFMKHHVDAVLAEFEYIDAVKHTSRKPTDAEAHMFEMMRRGK